MVVGECNTGKTSLINRLLGEPLLETAVIPNTTAFTLVAFAGRRGAAVGACGGERAPSTDHRTRAPVAQPVRRVQIGLPLEPLQSLQLLDTPGLAAGNEERDRQIRRACHRADLIVWCTLAMQAWKASERDAWLAFPTRLRARGILAITFADTIASLSDRASLMARLAAEAGAYFRHIAMAPAHTEGAAGRQEF